MTTNCKAFLRIRGVSFGSTVDDANALYAVAVFNPRTNRRSKYYTFHYAKRRNIMVKVNIDVIDKNSQVLYIEIYKMKTFKKQLVAKTVVPLAAFSENNVSQEKLVCMMETKAVVPMSVIFDLHLDLNNQSPYQAPLKKSTLPVFDSTSYFQNLQIAHSEDDKYNQIIDSPLLMH